MADAKPLTPHTTTPGTYLVETASGSTYQLEVRGDRSASMLRLPSGVDGAWFQSRPLHEDQSAIELTSFWLMEGRSGVFSYDDERARSMPDYRREPGDYAGTRRTTTPVTRIRRAVVPDAPAEL